MAFDRYAYTLNNPLRYTDPSGHRTCSPKQAATGDETCDQNYDPEDLKQSLDYLYGWNAVGDWTVEQLIMVLETARDLSDYVAEVTGNDGAEWIQNNLNAVFHNITNPSSYSYVLGNHVFLNFDNFFANKKQTIMHELAHVYDNNSGSSYCWATFCGNGYGSDFLKAYGGRPGYMNHLGSSGLLAFDDGPESLTVSYQFKLQANGGYGNVSTADYFAEAFSWSIYDSNKLPVPQMKLLINLYILRGGS